MDTKKILQRALAYTESLSDEDWEKDFREFCPEVVPQEERSSRSLRNGVNRVKRGKTRNSKISKTGKGRSTSRHLHGSPGISATNTAHKTPKRKATA